MKSVLEQLYKGEIMPIEQYRPMLEDCRKKFLKKEEKFSKNLDQQQRKELDILMEDYMALFPVEMEQEFSNGFKLGVHLMCEVFSEQEDNYLKAFKHMRENPACSKGV